MTIKKWIITGLALLGSLSLGFSQEAPGYFMHPDIHENTVVFVAEGDLWKTPLSGGVSKPLTKHAGAESKPNI